MSKVKGCLYVVATPIGNLSEMTPRAIEVLKSVSFIACEDTRNTVKLCHHFEISKPLISCHEHNEFNVVDKIVEAINNGEDIAVVSDAGYPGISDPGAIVIRKCIDNDIKVNVVSGPCAIINALVGSGLNTDHFYFHGFLPSKKSDRRKELEKHKARLETIVFYESPHRIADTLEDLLKVFGNRNACICRELTKKFEEFIRDSLKNLVDYITTNEIKGEIVLVVEGGKEEQRITVSNTEIINSVQRLIDQGMSAKDAIKEIATLNDISKNDVYRLFHQ